MEEEKKEIIEDNEKIITIVKKEPAEDKSTSSEILVTKDSITVQMNKCHQDF